MALSHVGMSHMSLDLNSTDAAVGDFTHRYRRRHRRVNSILQPYATGNITDSVHRD